MLKKITLKGIRDTLTTKLAMSPSRSTGNLNKVVSTIVDSDDEDNEGSPHLRRNYPLGGSPRNNAAASELNLGPRNQGVRKSLVQSLRHKIKSRKRIQLKQNIQVTAAQTFVPDTSNRRLSGAPDLKTGGDWEPRTSSTLSRIDTIRDAHDNRLYADLTANGTIVESSKSATTPEQTEPDDSNLDPNSRRVVMASQSSDSIFSEPPLLKSPASSSSSSCLGLDGLPLPTERKALPRMGAKTLKLKSPSSSCIAQERAIRQIKASKTTSTNDPVRGVENLGKARNASSDSGCSLDATPTSPFETEIKKCFEVEIKSYPSSLSSFKSAENEIAELMNHGWYWGPITRTEADEILATATDGSFLVRDSSDPQKYLLSLSFKSNDRVLHTRIQHSEGFFFFYHQPSSDGYPSIPALIEHSMEDSQTGSVFCYRAPKAPSLQSSPKNMDKEGRNQKKESPGSKHPVRLIAPVSRLSHVRSLTSMCKFEIKQTGLRAEA